MAAVTAKLVNTLEHNLHQPPPQTAVTMNVGQGTGNPVPHRRRSTGPGVAQVFWRLVLVLAVCRIALTCYSGLTNNRGDFYATLPGAYAETLNPALWNSPDLQDASGYQRSEYLYGPTQYLTILPLIFLDSYKAIATVLLVVYLALIAFSADMMWRSFRLFGGVPAHARTAVFASTFMFLPLLQAYVQREFEIVILTVTTLALYALATRREGLAGALMGYASWFKFFPLVFLPYFLLRRQMRAVVGFAVASALVLTLTATLLDLTRFSTVIELAGGQAEISVGNEAFCEVWSQPETLHHAVANNTRASIRWALCSFEARWPWLRARWIHTGSVAVIFGVFGFGYWQLRRQGAVEPSDEQWRQSLEVGFLLMSRWLLYAHYYYLVFAIVPLNALLVRYLAEMEAGRSCRRIWIWCGSYLLLSAFVVPPSVLSQVWGADFWRLYMQYNLYFFGEVLLVLLILWEYLTVPIRASDASKYSWRGRLWPSQQVVSGQHVGG